MTSQDGLSVNHNKVLGNDDFQQSIFTDTAGETYLRITLWGLKFTCDTNKRLLETYRDLWHHQYLLEVTVALRLSLSYTIDKLHRKKCP